MARIYNHFKGKWEDEFEKGLELKIRKIFQCKDERFYKKPKFYLANNIARYADKFQYSNPYEQARKNKGDNYQVMVKISSSCHSFEHLKNHIKYISRNGSLEIFYGDPTKKQMEENEFEIYQGKLENEALANELNKYPNLSTNADIKARENQGKNGEIKETYNMIFSMQNYHICSTKEIKLAAIRTIKALYPDNQFIIAMHNDTDNPHCHLILKRANESGKKISLNKKDLHKIRERFAANLRILGVTKAFTKPYVPEAQKEYKKVWEKGSHEYKILEYGSAKYDFKEENDMSFYVKYETTKGSKAIIWGKDLERVINENHLETGDYARFAIIGEMERKRIIKKYDKKAKKWRTYEATIFEKVWDANKYREEAWDMDKYVANDSKIALKTKQLTPIKNFHKNIYKEIQTPPPNPPKIKKAFIKEPIFDREFTLTTYKIAEFKKARKEYSALELEERLKKDEPKYTDFSKRHNHYTCSYRGIRYDLHDSFCDLQYDLNKGPKDFGMGGDETHLLDFKGFHLYMRNKGGFLDDSDDFFLILEEKDSFNDYRQRDKYLLGTINLKDFRELKIDTLLTKLNDEIVSAAYLKKKITDYQDEKCKNAKMVEFDKEKSEKIVDQYYENSKIATRQVELEKISNKEPKYYDTNDLLQDPQIKKYVKRIINANRANDRANRTNRANPATLHTRGLYLSHTPSTLNQRAHKLKYLFANDNKSVRTLSQRNLDKTDGQSSVLLPSDTQPELRPTNQHTNSPELRQPNNSITEAKRDDRAINQGQENRENKQTIKTSENLGQNFTQNKPNENFAQNQSQNSAQNLATNAASENFTQNLTEQKTTQEISPNQPKIPTQERTTLDYFKYEQEKPKPTQTTTQTTPTQPTQNTPTTQNQTTQTQSTKTTPQTPEEKAREAIQEAFSAYAKTHKPQQPQQRTLTNRPSERTI